MAVSSRPSGCWPGWPYGKLSGPPALDRNDTVATDSWPSSRSRAGRRAAEGKAVGQETARTWPAPRRRASVTAPPSTPLPRRWRRRRPAPRRRRGGRAGEDGHAGVGVAGSDVTVGRWSSAGPLTRTAAMGCLTPAPGSRRFARAARAARCSCRPPGPQRQGPSTEPGRGGRTRREGGSADGRRRPPPTRSPRSRGQRASALTIDATSSG